MFIVKMRVQLSILNGFQLIKRNNHEKIDTITNAIADSITPQIIPNIYVEEIEDKRVIVCEIFRGGSTPYYIKALGKESGTFIRTSSTTRLADESMLKELMLVGVNRAFDESN